MKSLYMSTLCVSADKSPSCSQIFPILKKLETHFKPRGEDSPFTTTLKETVWDELSTSYKDGDTWKFLQESSAMDPRFKNSIDSEEIWNRVKNAAIRASTSREMSDPEEHRLLQEDSDETVFPKRPRLTALEELFEEEDRALQSTEAADKTLSMSERVQGEIDLYRKLFPHHRTLWPGGGRDEPPFLSCPKSRTHTFVFKHRLLHLRESFQLQETQSAERRYTFFQKRLICRFFYRGTVRKQR
ncbi:zinc finger BED domain-containing protein 1-like [Xyrichtys novacula]|uniref:Zinc finger BED domain-containing protein 1-like n=1 Tax=Xyrichtys novacula TaxID=13765 RepID=A0AAV1FV48_XYRNO|nr:zinc finger BED domain-containing protein 1-like [Xyrichtys novacula]